MDIKHEDRRPRKDKISIAKADRQRLIYHIRHNSNCLGTVVIVEGLCERISNPNCYGR
jgi:hypothetical protein